MRKFKNKLLYRWLSQQNDKDDNPLTDVLVIPGQNVNSPSQGKLEPMADVKNSNVRPSLGKLEPVTYVENFNECPSLEKLEPVTYVENLNECSYKGELESVIVSNLHKGPSLGKLEPVTYVENFNECPSQHKLESVTHVENLNERPSQGELEPVTYVESLTESAYQDDLETITYVENFSEGAPHGYTSVAWDETNNESLQPNEMTSETYVESINEITTVYEIRPDSLEDAVSETAVQSAFKTSLSNYTDTSTAVSEITSMSTDESIDETSNIKNITRTIVSTFAFRIFGILLVFVDMFLIISDLIITDVKIGFGCHAISLAIALFFLFDVLLRVYLEGRHHYFSDFLNTLDAAIIVITLMIDATYFFFDVNFLKNLPRLAVLFRPLRLIILIRVFHLAHQKRQLETLTRRLVSGNKRRYQKDGFDLDLTYVTERIIAMSFPSSGKQSFYRNPIKEVVRFLDTKHPDHYRVYNLCSEKGYNPKYFHNRVHRIMIDDHNVPSLSEMVEFSKEVTKWLDEDKENVVVIHCKGGKGRTGTMVCACLISSQLFYTAEDSLSFFGHRRTDQTSSTKYQGVETPSQNRYVEYFEKVKRVYHWDLPPRKILKPNKIIIYSIHSVGKGDGSDLNVQVLTKQNLIYSCSSQNCKIFHDIEMDRVIIDLSNCPVVYDDVKMRFLSKKLPNYYDKCAFFFWFHTSFIQNNRLYLQRNQLDNPHKPKSWNIYHSQFAVEVYFDKT